MLVPRFRKSRKLALLVEEVTRLRAAKVEREVKLEAKDEAMNAFVSARIAEWNSAIRATNGPKRGESEASYRARLVAANTKK